jgi:hypothetical protein
MMQDTHAQDIQVGTHCTANSICIEVPHDYNEIDSRPRD